MSRQVDRVQELDPQYAILVRLNGVNRPHVFRLLQNYFSHQRRVTHYSDVVSELDGKRFYDVKEKTARGMFATFGTVSGSTYRRTLVGVPVAMRVNGTFVFAFVLVDFGVESAGPKLFASVVWCALHSFHFSLRSDLRVITE